MFENITSNPLAVSLVSLAAGAVITVIVSKLRNKTEIFRYTVINNQIGLSADDPIFGSIRVTWQDKKARNLYIVIIEVENSTFRDYENIKFKVYTDDKTFLLGEMTEILNSPYIVPWSQEFRDSIYVQSGQQPTELQVRTYYHGRDYQVPAFNRGQILKFTYLCTRSADDMKPNVCISTCTKGIKLRFQVAPVLTLRPLFGVPVPSAIKRGIFLSAIVVILCGYFLDIVWLAALISMLVGLTAQLLGAMIFKVEKFIKNLVAG